MIEEHNNFIACLNCPHYIKVDNEDTDNKNKKKSDNVSTCNAIIYTYDKRRYDGGAYDLVKYIAEDYYNHVDVPTKPGRASTRTRATLI